MKSGGEEGQIDVLTFIFPVFVPAAVALTVQSVKYCIQIPSCGRIERSDFWETESIRQVNRIERIQIVNWNALVKTWQGEKGGIGQEVLVKVNFGNPSLY